MQKHNFWQATRKASLYPENWIDPTLRDDKTDLFDAYEAAIMQKDLNWDTFTAAIRNYVHSLSQIAHLEIQAYLRDHRKGISEVYHLFGRTRSTPYQLYYRKFHLPRPSGHGWWSPWSKIELETTTYESDWNGDTLAESGIYLTPVMRGNRLFLYIPQIMLKTVPPPPPGPASGGSKGIDAFAHMATSQMNTASYT